uniref:Eco57I restriction-modification methylase domain-containing protein n=1 Tax=Halococcus sediminicola TaxID=1264579 RepID=UPI000679AC83|nr:N-6 DNA methylase [Halococcus sediminicola]
MSDRHLAEVIYRLSTTETDEGHVAADYADLDTRHLGTIYEGLLEHEFAVAPEAQAAVAGDGGQVWKPADEVSVAEAVETVEQGELYVVNDDGERKATGAYYTPDYVVTYIVEETVGPLLSDIEAELSGLEPGTEEYVVAFWERVTDLKILDPAMGSGHFLTKATAYLTNALMEEVREVDENVEAFDDEDDSDIRRRISRECIYGVDVNGMATELAKLSMWLETLAADQPLAFLDHHLKAGNSLVGSDITEVLSNDDGDELTSENEENGTVQSTFDYFEQVRRRALDHVMNRMSELLAIDNETLDEIHSMKAIYAEMREDPLYEHLQAMATVHTASEFGLDVPEDAIERMARAIEDDEEWAALEATDWFRAARAMADEEGFFHWELEFPAVFFDMDGDRLASAGFDAVVGNPPYVQAKSTMKKYLKQGFSSTQFKIDLFHAFIEQAINRLRNDGEFGYIIPKQWLTLENTSLLRKYVIENGLPRSIVDFDNRVFNGATVDTIIMLLTKDKTRGEMSILSAHNVGDSIIGITERRTGKRDDLVDDDDYRIEIRQSSDEIALIEKINSISVRFGSVSDVSIGIQAYGQSDHTNEQIENRVFHSNEKRTENHLPLATGTDISRYSVNLNGNNYVDYGNHLHRPRESKYFKGERVVLREITDSGKYRIHAAYTDRDFVGYKTTLSIVSVSEYSNQFLTAILNSSLLSWYFIRTSNKIIADSFPRISLDDVEELPLPEINFKDSEHTAPSSFEEILYDLIHIENGLELPDELCERTKYTHDFVNELCNQRMADSEKRRGLNLDLLDYLGTYADGPPLGERYQPASGLHESVLTDTQADSEFATLRVTAARIERDGDHLRVLAVPYVKPENPDEYETNSRGYATLDPVPAMEFVGLSEAEAALVEAFVPHAVAEAGGFAGYRDNATATISPLDRLESLTLPKLADVEGGIERYVDASERAAELDAKIERTDELIDQIVYELYGLTDEEIEIVEDAVGE